MRTKLFLILIILFYIPIILKGQVHEEWDVRYRGPNDDFNMVTALTYDNYGNVYVTGQSKKINSYVYDILTVKYNHRGELQWVVRRDSTYPGRIEVDNTGNVIVSGTSNNHYVTTKYTSYGTILWEAVRGGQNNDMVVDDFGNIYVTGYGYEGILKGFLTMKYSPTGTLLWTAKYMSNLSGNEARRVKIDNAGNVYVAGIVYFEGVSNLVLIKYNNNGQQLWWSKTTQPISGYFSNYVGLEIDDNGNIYTSGSIWSPDQVIDFIITKFNSNGNEVWFKRYNSVYNLNDEIKGMVVAGNGDMYITGNIQVDTFFHSQGLVQKYDSAGQIKWEKYIGSTSEYINVADITSDIFYNIYVTSRVQINNGKIIMTNKYDSLGNLKWAIDYIGIGGHSYVNTLRADNYGNIYVGGSTDVLPHLEFLTIRYLQSWNSNSMITGCVKFQNNNQPVTSGNVKAFKLERNTGNLIIVDSTVIQISGYYSLKNIPQDSLYLVAFPSDNPDFVPAFYPQGISWQSAQRVYTPSNLSNINISVPPITSSTGNSSINGKVMALENKTIMDLKDAILYAKNGNNFISYSKSGINGIYLINSLPAGNMKIVATRIGYTSDSINCVLNSSSNLDSINFYLNRAYVRIHEYGQNVPSNYKLHQNYPNPFNPKTKIRFDIPRLSHVKLIIYDALGREVTTLVNEKLSAGSYEVEWPAPSGDGGMYPSGVYFYSIQTKSFKETKRMVLIK